MRSIIYVVNAKCQPKKKFEDFLQLLTDIKIIDSKLTDISASNYNWLINVFNLRRFSRCHKRRANFENISQATK